MDTDMGTNKRDDAELSGMVLAVSVATNTGWVRSENQDNFYADHKLRHYDGKSETVEFHEKLGGTEIFSVCDGLGGEKGGRICSEIAVETLSRERDAIIDASPAELDGVMNRYAAEANNAICSALHCRFWPEGGTTFTGIIIKGDTVYPYYLGDSRIYMYHNKSLTLLTEDHTVAMEKVHSGEYTLEQAFKSRENHMLTQFLGMDNFRKGIRLVPCPSFPAEAGLRLLLCSDGLHDMLSDDEIRVILAEPGSDPAMRLVEAALGAGGHDNVTCIVLTFEKA